MCKSVEGHKSQLLFREFDHISQFKGELQTPLQPLRILPEIGSNIRIKTDKTSRFTYALHGK